ncbi:hypothetical protein D9757_009683 [Collybiopsis confluens]|uniref:G-patch domain-containing protein n=1 Tax=Collybiopsis confluens TaxID=2823264 RepID=A0A8H5LZP3_9AGAR|nr:hypothetical protein D9757_009683 [Collybiopsis confluens]
MSYDIVGTLLILRPSIAFSNSPKSFNAMTSRLKRKLGDIGVDTHSAKANENFCLIGTPLPPLEKSRDTGEFVPLWKQEVRDEKGRRRLHGAFTGGFSAGYFNTVGSKEGWAPQTFVSSRSDRAKKKQVKPEDFMDEEDLQDLADSREIVDTTDEMDLAGGNRTEEQNEDETDPLTSTLQNAMLPATKDSVGASILKKMGWRVGQGIGPRITLKQRRLQDLQASGGTGQSGPLDVADDDSEEADKHTYAPRDTPILVAGRKDNNHGLGYRPGMSLNESLGAKGAGMSHGPNISSGFGLGALNDADDDDVDIYDGASSSARNRLAYDASDDRDGDRVSLGGPGNKSNLRSAPAKSPVGTAILPGFVLSDKPVMEDRWYPLPDIPPGWKPDPKRVWSKSQNPPSDSKDKENIKQPSAMAHSQWKTSGLSADERGTILGEAPLPSAPHSVFDFMSEKDRDRLKNIAESIRSGSKVGDSANETSSSNAIPVSAPAPRIARTDPQIARAALNGFQPFGTNLIKQARYTAYLQSQAQANSNDADAALTLEPLPRQSIPEFNSEMEEYAQSAIVFKPMSGAMAGRFTRSAVIEEGPNVIAGLHTPIFTPSSKSEKDQGKASSGGITFVDGDGDAVSEQGAREEEEQQRKVENQDLSPKENAARLGMYGPLTREAKPWQPARLLCKRPFFFFNCPNRPSPTTTSSAAAASFAAATFDPSSASGADLEKFGISIGGAGTGFPASASGSRLNLSKSGRLRDLTNIGLGDEDDTQGRDTLTYERPSVDIFKAIFASDDEDSDDGGDGGEEEHKEGIGEGSGTNRESMAVPVLSSATLDPAPVPLVVDDPSALASAPAPPAAQDFGPVDLSTFKPTFVRKEKDTKMGNNNKEGGIDGDEKKKDKKDKKKKEKRKAIVSFVDDEGDDGGLALNVVVDKPKRKKRKKEKDKEAEVKDKGGKPLSAREEKDDMDMWVEKPNPTDVVSAETGPSSQDGGAGALAVVGTTKGRKRAVDFL